MTAALAALNPAAQVALVSCEQRIERGLKSFLDVGSALAEIRDSRLYRQTHATFEDYCRERWNLSRPRAYEMIGAAEVVSGMPDMDVPISNARQASALAAVPEPERADVWREATERTGGKPTAKVVAEVAKERTQNPGPVETPSTASTGPGPTPAPAAAAPGPSQEPAQKPALRLVPDADEVRAAEQRDARGLLRRAVEMLAPAHDRPGFAETWARQLGPYDSELSDLIRRATEAIATLDDLIERCGQ